MFQEIFFHQYFWLSFLPIALLGGGFWLLYFDRFDEIKEPLILLILALFAGILSAICFGTLASYFDLQNFFGKIIGEEITKILFAILAMEMLKQKFHNVSQGIMYGFAIGLGFAVAENIVYLVNVYAISEFSAQFWLAFQGRFWTTTLLHGITTAFFGLFYAGAYLSKTLQKGKNESPLLVLLAPFQLKQLWTAFSLHNARKHLIFKMNNSLLGHSARTVILEGFWLAIIIHIIFNMALDKNQSWIAIFIVLFGTWQLKKCSNLIKSL